jgi:soluble lytic murein transglycosylase-like protein
MNIKYGFLIIGLISNVSLASDKDFNKAEYLIIKDIIWAADKAEVPRALLLSVCWTENRFNANNDPTHIDGKSLSYGQCQIKLGTASHMDWVFKHKTKVTAERLKTVKINAFYAAKYLKTKLKKYNGNWQLAADAYNKNIAISVNTKYVKKFNTGLSIVSSKLSHLIK